MEKLLVWCREGRLKEARGLVSFHFTIVGIPYTDGEGFRFVCKNGGLEVVQGFWGLLGGVDIHADDDYDFRCACMRGKLELAQWLWSLGGVDIHARDDEAFVSACFCAHLEIARWLLSVDSCVSPFVYENLHHSRLRSWSRARAAWCSWV
jgi:hypothetical protein